MPDMGFNEQQQDALGALFEQFWILRDKDPEAYQLIRENERALRRYIIEKFGLSLIVHKDFIKLEKVPLNPEKWMGIGTFQEPRDYALFACGLAYLENRSVEDHFLLSEFANGLKEMYPGVIALDWTNYQHRKSLVRVLKKLVELDCIHEVDSYSGGVEGFAYSEEQEVLYKGTIYSRYFMRNHLHDIRRCESLAEILDMDWERNQEDLRRKRVYRKLMYEPVVYRESEDDLDFDYIRRYRNSLREDIESHTPFALQVTKNAAMLTLPEQKQLYELFPDRKALSTLVLHVQAYVRATIHKYIIDTFGQIHLTHAQFEQLIQQVRADYKVGWSIEYREKRGLKKTSEDILMHLMDWSFAKVEAETNLIVLLPAFGRMTGYYPKDFESEDHV
ncbi:TIGR02678 family protein [Alkalibacterium subtropicum]|uniref:TIGR02678 family protein n=1 Tax=Alkalibacterium subtropicum TaxID=753702 RepID=A0A1I1GCK6_9LACT|nr:TIGR02678 family protein [Alkalibacterium subtropicum]SFC09479.1 TIGR02678 family protein [Alkalibacterium subtropicum]